MANVKSVCDAVQTALEGKFGDGVLVYVSPVELDPVDHSVSIRIYPAEMAVAESTLGGASVLLEVGIDAELTHRIQTTDNALVRDNFADFQRVIAALLGLDAGGVSFVPDTFRLAVGYEDLETMVAITPFEFAVQTWTTQTELEA